jgi:hypothetical protein
MNEENESEVFEDLASFGVKSNGKCRNCGALGYKVQDCRSKTQQNGRNYGNSQNGIY